jgi:branched-chain amino acid transport system ATP-binding protein
VTDAPLLEVCGLTAGYHGIDVLHHVDLAVRPGEFVTVLGANGAGKSTLMKALIGLEPARGTVRFRDQDLLRRPAHHRVQLGIAYVPEGRRVFPALTVEENLKAVSRRNSKRTFEEGFEQVRQIFPRLGERRDQLAGTLSGGEQQMLAMARALISEPDLLLADEISLGLAPMVVESMFDVLRDLNRAGMAILLAEQNAHAALEYADTAHVLETGRVTVHGSATELMADQRVLDAYLQVM